MTIKDDPAYLFTLRIPGQYQGEPMITIHAWERPAGDTGTHWGLEFEVRQGGRVVFPRGSLWGAVSHVAGQSVDGPWARELAIGCAAMKPGDTDSDYFADYTPEQLEWAGANGEYLSIVAEERYPECR